MGAGADFNARLEEQDEEYLKAWADMSPEDRAKLAAEGIDGPELSEFTTRSQVFREDTASAVEAPETTTHDDIAWILLNLAECPNSKLAIQVMLKAMKVSPFGEQSDDSLARPFGVTKATVSGLRGRMSASLEVILGAGKDQPARCSYALSNPSQTKLSLDHV